MKIKIGHLDGIGWQPFGVWLGWAPREMPEGYTSFAWVFILAFYKPWGYFICRSQFKWFGHRAYTPWVRCTFRRGLLT